MDQVKIDVEQVGLSVGTPRASRRRVGQRSSLCARETDRSALPRTGGSSGPRDTVLLRAVLPLDRGSGGKLLLA